MDTASIVIAVISGLLQIIGYVVYNHLAQKGHIKPDGASWAIWAFGSALNLFSYGSLTQDWVKDILPFCCALSCMITFGVRAYRKQFGRISAKGWVILLADIGITLVWFFTSAMEASLLYQLSTVLSFIPMIMGVMKGEDKEEVFPWIIWTCAYAMLGVSVYMRLNHLVELAYPVTCFVMHAIMTYIAWRNRPQSKQ
ncbi:MAG: hypothetical protein RIT04_648 [Candidatus Parcubacteria bacterium]|jgi:hypothetical protein